MSFYKGSALIILSLSLCAVMGCAGIGPTTVSRDRSDYTAAISDSWQHQNRNAYFWIDDRDLMSKKIFSFLMFVFTLVETGEKGTTSIVTVPTG